MEFGYTCAEFDKCNQNNKDLANEYEKKLSTTKFDDQQYIDYLAKSFAYYWLYSSEGMPSTIENFYNILDDDFVIRTSTNLGVISDREEAILWLDSFRRTARYSYHKIEDFKSYASEESSNDMQVIIIEMTIDYYGLGITGSKINNKIEYKWIIEKELDGKYPRIREMEFKTISSFNFIK